MEEGPVKAKGKGTNDSKGLEHTGFDEKMETRELIDRKASRMI